MNLFKIDYTIKKTGMQYKVVIIAKNKEKAEHFLRRKVNADIRINSFSSVSDPIHAIDDDIINQIISNSPKITKYQEKIRKLESEMQEMEKELKELHVMLDEKDRMPSSKDIATALKTQKIKVYCCPHCKFETESLKGLKIHINKQHDENKTQSDM